MIQPLPADYFSRQDERDDDLFYTMPRRVVHIDEGAIAALSEIYYELLPPEGTYLDLMSSWRSHLPEGLNPASVTGLGLNAEEMDDNPQLDDYVVHNLNLNPQLPFTDEQFDAVLCTVSVQYLTQPVTVFQEILRVLKPTGSFIVSFSNRCFPMKAVVVWLGTNDEQHVSLVSHYFESSSKAWSEPKLWQKPATGQGDPLYVVWAVKESVLGF